MNIPLDQEQLQQLAAAPPIRNFLRKHNLIKSPGLSLFDSAKLQAGRNDQWDAVAQAANADRETYKQLLRGLATTTNVKRGPQFEQAIDAGSKQISQLAPYLMTAAPNLWDQLHGSRGSAASLASSIAQAHPDRTPLENASMAQSIHSQMPQDGGLASNDLGQVYKTMASQGMLGQHGLEAARNGSRVINVGQGLRSLIDAGKGVKTAAMGNKDELQDDLQTYIDSLPDVDWSGIYVYVNTGSPKMVIVDVMDWGDNEVGKKIGARAARRIGASHVIYHNEQGKPSSAAWQRLKPSKPTLPRSIKKSNQLSVDESKIATAVPAWMRSAVGLSNIQPGPEPLNQAMVGKKWKGFKSYSMPDTLRHYQTTEYSGPPTGFVTPPKKPQLLLRLQSPQHAVEARKELAANPLAMSLVNGMAQ